MSGSDYLIVGGGMTAAAAVRGIREVDQDGSITIVGAEPEPPYARPPLTKGLWGSDPEDSIWDEFDHDGVDLHLGHRIVKLDPASRLATDDEGAEMNYCTLLLATGVSPRILTDPGERIVHFRTLRDYRHLRELAQTGDHIVVIGGGFIGSELAAALSSNGKRVTLIFPGGGIGARIYPQELAVWLNGYYAEHGIEVLAGTRVTGIEEHDGSVTVRIRTGEGSDREVQADAAVIGIGTTPNVDLAKQAGLDVDNGILVDELLRAGHPQIFAAGDVANVYMPALGGRRRIEHEDNANVMGQAAGRAMAGASTPWEHLPFFYSDLFDLGYEAVGDLDPRLEVVTDWHEPNREGVVYYLRDDRVRGVLLWNVWDQVDTARELIKANEPVDRADVAGWLSSSR